MIYASLPLFYFVLILCTYFSSIQVPFVGRWKDHSSLDRSSVEAFLTSVGLPMYCSVFEEFGYSSVELIQSASPEQLYILPLSDRHRKLLSKALLSL